MTWTLSEVCDADAPLIIYLLPLVGKFSIINITAKIIVNTIPTIDIESVIFTKLNPMYLIEFSSLCINGRISSTSTILPKIQ
ncbi:hypothetical protein psyc5s11_54550 [Clostridium gelidum]|uniref:Uncharacterized protein n=1 Tax=Clostridium gelidum TaxID=704125 RepID=A0ABN6J7G8_9CLOT|nr:hypothetical protein [Clostridium gelidum]BCZ49388.1 hypothetical protein psyc5s11_54550 [Clostridium gelidum]